MTPQLGHSSAVEFLSFNSARRQHSTTRKIDAQLTSQALVSLEAGWLPYLMLAWASSAFVV